MIVYVYDWPPQTYPCPSRLPPPAIWDIRLRGGIHVYETTGGQLTGVGGGII